MSSDIKYFQDFGGEKVVFEREETTKVKRITDQGVVHILIALLLFTRNELASLAYSLHLLETSAHASIYTLSSTLDDVLVQAKLIYF